MFLNFGGFMNLEDFKNEVSTMLDSDSFALAVQLYKKRLENRKEFASLIDQIGMIFLSQSHDKEKLEEDSLREIFFCGLKKNVKFASSPSEMPPLEQFKRMWTDASSCLIYYTGTYH